VHEQARQSAASEIVVATDDERIVAVAEGFGARVMMTSPTHVSGTDRIAEVTQVAGWPEDDIVVNLQGDEPLMPARLIDQVALLLEQTPDASVATLASPLTGIAQFLDPNVVKVVTDVAGRALYFSRAPIPWGRDSAVEGLASQRSFTGARRHIGLYAYRIACLRRLAVLKPTVLEHLEKLEQLRALENGIEIRVGDALLEPGPDVNTIEDLQRVAMLLPAHKAH
jgi:3-deoxy-manno-octulosonate cytidylyltransferase (CMP-KDO synthetase)